MSALGICPDSKCVPSPSYHIMKIVNFTGTKKCLHTSKGNKQSQIYMTFSLFLSAMLIKLFLNFNFYVDQIFLNFNFYVHKIFLLLFTTEMRDIERLNLDTNMTITSKIFCSLSQLVMLRDKAGAYSIQGFDLPIVILSL